MYQLRHEIGPNSFIYLTSDIYFFQAKFDHGSEADYHDEEHTIGEHKFFPSKFKINIHRE